MVVRVREQNDQFAADRSQTKLPKLAKPEVHVKDKPKISDHSGEPNQRLSPRPA